MHAATMALPATTRPALLARVNSRCPVAVADLASVSLPRGRGSAAACDRGGVICTAVKGHSARSVCCSKTLVAKPDTIDAVVDLCQRAVAFSRSRLGRGSGVREFSCSQDAFEPHILHFFEVYDSTAAMGKHNTTRELSDFLEQARVAQHTHPFPHTCVHHHTCALPPAASVSDGQPAAPPPPRPPTSS